MKMAIKPYQRPLRQLESGKRTILGLILILGVIVAVAFFILILAISTKGYFI